MQTRVQILQKNEFEILKQILLYLYEILNLLYSEFVYGVVLMFFLIQVHVILLYLTPVEMSTHDSIIFEIFWQL